MKSGNSVKAPTRSMAQELTKGIIMKVLTTKLMMLPLSFLLPHIAMAAYHDQCEPSKTARQAVKALFAISDTKGVESFAGGAKQQDSLTTIVSVVPHFKASTDHYEVTVRNSDCRVLSLVLRKENVPLATTTGACWELGFGCKIVAKNECPVKGDAVYLGDNTVCLDREYLGACNHSVTKTCRLTDPLNCIGDEHFAGYGVSCPL